MTEDRTCGECAFCGSWFTWPPPGEHGWECNLRDGGGEYVYLCRDVTHTQPGCANFQPRKEAEDD